MIRLVFVMAAVAIVSGCVDVDVGVDGGDARGNETGADTETGGECNEDFDCDQNGDCWLRLEGWSAEAKAVLTEDFDELVEVEDQNTPGCYWGYDDSHICPIDYGCYTLIGVPWYEVDLITWPCTGPGPWYFTGTNSDTGDCVAVFEQGIAVTLRPPQEH